MAATVSVIPNDYNVDIICREIVVPALQMQEHLLPLSNLDLAIPPVSVDVFFCYNKPPDQWTFGSLISHLKSSLSSILVNYYVFAGELVTNNAGHPELLCNSNGVEFTQAYAATALADVAFCDPDNTVEGKLVPLLPEPSQGKGSPVFAVQVTEFSCGGIVVGCTFHHMIADAFSGNMFFCCWAKLSANQPIDCLIPNFTRSILCPRVPPVVDKLYVKQTFVDSGQQISPLILASRIYHMNAKSIENLQASINHENGNKYSKLECFCAYLWKLLTGLNSQDMKNSRIGIAVDGRPTLMKSGMAANYFGNVVAFAFAEAAVIDITTRPLSWIANIIHSAIYTTATKEYFQSLIDLVERTKTSSIYKITDAGALSTGHDVIVSSGLRFPLYEVDYGWGRPKFASYHLSKGTKYCYVMPIPSSLRDGSWTVCMQLPIYQLDAIEGESTSIFTAITQDHLLFYTKE